MFNYLKNLLNFRSPFWLFNLFSSIFRLRISTQFDRIVINIIHLFPYINCALNPLLYAAQAENFRRAFKSLFCSFNFSIVSTKENNNKNLDTLTKQGGSTVAIGITSTSSIYNEADTSRRCAGIGEVIFTSNVLTNGYSLANYTTSYIKYPEE